MVNATAFLTALCRDIGNTRPLFAPVLSPCDRISHAVGGNARAIRDGRRALGQRLTVAGNLKYDFSALPRLAGDSPGTRAFLEAGQEKPCSGSRPAPPPMAAWRKRTMLSQLSGRFRVGDSSSRRANRCASMLWRRKARGIRDCDGLVALRSMNTSADNSACSTPSANSRGTFEHANAVFMGGTLSEMGHNILEPALAGKSVIAGTASRKLPRKSSGILRLIMPCCGSRVAANWRRRSRKRRQRIRIFGPRGLQAAQNEVRRGAAHSRRRDETL